mgnify:FL=1
MTITYPAPLPPWSTNEDRNLHWGRRAERVKAWHDAAYWNAKQAGWNHPSKNNRPSTVQLTVTYPTKRRRDASNLVGTIVKASVDGLVAAGVFPDDTPEWVTVLEPVILVAPGWHVVSIEVKDRP